MALMNKIFGTAYQQNLAQPVQTQKQEEPWSIRRVMGNIAKISAYDQPKAQKMFDDLMYLQTDATSKYYNPYSNATNKAVENLASYGIDTNRIDDQFFRNNDYLLGYLSYNGQTNTPTKPGKKASNEEKAAWEYYQIKISEDATKKVEQQWNALQDELNYWANRKDRNYSDDEIISRIDWSKYGALTDLETKQRDGKPAELNRGTTFSRDAMYGVLWAARNGGSSGSIYGDMARSYNGEGTPWKYDQTIAYKLNPKSESYNPYAVGSTIDDAALYFNVDKFDQGWLQQNDGMQYGQDATAKKMYQKVLAAEGVTQKAEQELAELNKWVDRKLQNAKTEEAADKILDRIDWNKYPTLSKMDQTIGKGDMPGSGDLLQLTRAVDYRYADLEKRVRDACYENAKVPMDVEYVDDLDAMTGVAPMQTTDIDSAIIKDQNKRLEDAADLFDGAGTGSEQSMGKNLWSTAFGWVKDGVAQALNAIPGKFTELTQNTVRNSIGIMSSSMLTDADVVQNYNIAQANIPKLQKQKADLEAQMGGTAGFIDAGKFDPSIVDEKGEPILSGQKGWDLLTDTEKNALTVMLNNADSPNAIDFIGAIYDMYVDNHIKDSNVDEATKNAYRDVVNQLADAEAYVAANQETYDEATANAKSAQEQYDATIAMFDKAGLDSTELKKARTVSDFLLGFTKYNPTTWESENVYAEYSHMAMQNDGSFDKMFQVAEQTDKEIMDNIELAEWVLEYSDKNGVQMPDSVRNNVERWLHSMQRQHEDFENLSVLKNADASERATEGEAFAKADHTFDWDAYGTGGLESLPLWGVLSEEQQNRLKNLEAIGDTGMMIDQYDHIVRQMDLDNRMFGTYQMKDLLMDYEKETYYYKLATEGIESADAYIDHLADASYGVLNTRAAEKTKESADALAGSGFWGRRAADALSMLMSPVAAIGSAYYMAEVGLAKLRGEDVEVNPNNVNLSANIYKKEARGKIQEEIKKTYGKQIVNEDGSITYEDTPLSQFMGGLQEIISNRGDSMINALTFGPLFKNVDPEMLNEFLSAMPMAFTAATDAVAEAKENGASDTQLLGIFAATLLAEAGTEAISIDNMRAAFGAGTEGFTTNGVKDFVRNWLTKAGISEMFGESLNDVIENTADEIFMGDQSEYQKLVNKYKTEEHMSQEEAELAARRDQMMGVLHTALISYLSPGMDIVSYTAGRFNSAREKTRDLQQKGYDVSIFDVMRMDKEQRNRANAEQTEVQNEQAETTEETAPAEETAPITETQEQTESSSAEEVGTAVPENEADKAVEIDPEEQKAQRIAADYQILDNAGKADAASQTASIAAVLQTDESDAASDAAKAAAAKLNEMVASLPGKQLTPTEWLKNLWLGASETNVPLEAVKSAVQSAVLGGEQSAAYHEFQKGEFRKADFDAQVLRLAKTVEIDAANQTVQDQIAKSIHEARIVEAEGQIIANGQQLGGSKVAMAQKAMQTADKVAKTLLRVKTDLEARQTELETASQAVNQANADLRENPTDQNRKRVIGAISKYNSLAAVVQEYQQSLAKAEADQQTAEENANRLREEALTEIRQQAEQVVAQQDEQRAGRIAQEQQIAQQEAEQAAQLQAEQDELTGKAREDRADMLIEDLLNRDHLEGEEREQKRQQYKDMADKVLYKRIDMNGLMNNTEGMLAIHALSRKLGVQIQLSDALPAGARGKYQNGVVYLNSNLIKQGKMTVGQAMVETALHEITHHMENTKSYGRYKQIVFNTLFNSDAAKSAAIDQKIADYKAFGQDLTREQAEAEIVADFARTKLNGKDVVQRFMDAGMGGKMRNALHNINESLKNFYGQLKGEDRTTAENLRKAERAFQKAINEAAKTSLHPEGNQFSVKQFAEAAGMTVDENTLQLFDQNGREIDGVNNKVTSDMINGTPVGMLIDMAEQGSKAKNGNVKFAPTISSETAQAQKQMFADLMNMVAQYKDSNLVWEIASSTMFSALKSNSDPQYSTTVDFGTVCAKTQEIINVMSRVMLEKQRGLTREEVLKVYNETANADLTVPCPVCYVFSRWMGVPSLLNKMSQYQERFVKTDKDGNIDWKKTQKIANDYIKDALEKYGDKEGIDKAKNSITNRMRTQETNRTNALTIMNSEEATAEEKAKAKEKHDAAIKQLDALSDELGEVEAFNWVTQALCKQERKGKKTVNVLDKNGNYVVDTAFELTPNDVLFDLRRTGEFAKYTKNWSYRNTRGAGMGKAIMPYSGMSIGDIVFGTTRKNQVQNPFLTQEPTKAADGVKNAVKRAKQQNLIGGQRLQSTSDFRPEWGLDYMMAFLELQAVGSKVQMYTKVAEAVDLLASMGGDINLSIMGQGQGWHEENGKKVLDYSDVTGMKYETAKALKDKYDNVQMILVGMNDTHIRLALENPDIDFVIPWHSSGNSKDALASMIASVGENLETSSDYTDYQTDKPSENQTDEQKKLWDLRMKILQGKKINGEERTMIYEDEYLKSLYDRFNVQGVDDDCYQVKLGKDQAEQIFPYEYWDKSLTKDQADQNGKNFVDYCEHFGLVPRFSQFKDDTGYWKLLIDRPMYDNAGNYRDQQVVDVTKAKIGQIENGKLVNSDMPLETSAMYGPNYSDKEKMAVDNSLAAIDPPAQINCGQYSVFGDTTLADMEDMLTSDEDYLSAVERGDMETAQRDVNEAAKETGYTIEAFHGTRRNFTEFDPDTIGRNYQGYSKYGKGFYFSSDENVANGWGKNGNVIDAYLKMDNPYVLPLVESEGPLLDEFNRLRALEGKKPSAEEPGGFLIEMLNGLTNDKGYSTEFLKGLGYDGIVIEHPETNSVGSRPAWSGTTEYVVFNPDQIKSADPVTYDDQGNVIPLSERFNTNEQDIRYSASGDMTESDMEQYFADNGIIEQNAEPEGPQRQFGSQTAQRSDELSEQAKQYLKAHSDYIPDTNEAQIDRAVNWIRSNRTEADPTGYNNSLQKVTDKNFDYRSADGQARMLSVMGMAIAQNDITAQVAIADAYNKQGTTLGQALQSRKIFRLMTPEGRISTLQKMLSNTQDELNAKGTNINLKFSDWIYRAAAEATEEGDFAKVQQAAAAELAQQLPANWKDRFRSFRMFSMLANPRTHIRNVIGNALFVPAVGLKNKLGAIAEIATRQKERTKTLAPFLNSDVRQFARMDAQMMKDILTGEAKYNELNPVDQQKKAFKGLLQAAMDFNSNALEAEDWLFLKGHYRKALGGWMQANGYTAEQLQNDAALLEKGRTYAINEAQKATYRDFSQLASSLNQVSKKGGVAGFIVDATLPFKKTPANILKRGMEYSPAGIMRSLTTDIYHLKQYLDYNKGKLNALPEKAISPAQFIDHLCSGLAGSAILTVGALLANAGVVSCGLDDDDDELEKLKGNQKYSINLKDTFIAKILGEDITFTMDWAAPMSMPFFVGAAIQNQLAKGGDLDADELINAFANITEPVFNLSMLDGINTVFKTSQYDDTNTLTQIGAKIGSNYMTSYVPSVIGAIARTIDDKQRKNFVESGKGTGVLGTFRYAAEQVQNKIPGLNQQNIATRDVWGNEETTGLAERILENFILPGYVNEYKDDPLLNEIGRVADATQDYSIVPSDPPKSFSYKNQKIVLTDKQWDAYKRDRGQTAFDMLTDLIKNPDYQNASPATQADMISKVWSYADKMGKKAVIPDFDMVTNTVDSIAAEGKIDGYKNEMLKALQLGDIDAYETMVEALHDEEVEDSEIKKKIQDTYINKYKEAYRTGDYETMVDIQDIFDDSGFDFNTDAWEEAVDKKYGI